MVDMLDRRLKGASSLRELVATSERRLSGTSFFLGGGGGGLMQHFYDIFIENTLDDNTTKVSIK